MKYYKPILEDFHEGFIFEYCPDIFKRDNKGNSIYKQEIYSNKFNEFTIHSLGIIYTIDELCQTDLIRVKALTKEDIESCNFICYSDMSKEHKFKLLNSNIKIQYDYDNATLFVQVGFATNLSIGANETLFKGQCKSLNDFKKIMSML